MPARRFCLFRWSWMKVLEVPDRILVMYEGSIVGELDPRYTTAKELGLYMAGAQRNV